MEGSGGRGYSPSWRKPSRAGNLLGLRSLVTNPGSDLLRAESDISARNSDIASDRVSQATRTIPLWPSVEWNFYHLMLLHPIAGAQTARSVWPPSQLEGGEWQPSGIVYNDMNRLNKLIIYNMVLVKNGWLIMVHSISCVHYNLFNTVILQFRIVISKLW